MAAEALRRGAPIKVDPEGGLHFLKDRYDTDAAERLGHGGSGVVPRRRASARVAQHDDLFFFVVADVAAAFGDAGAVCSSRGT